jgi:hypothetical protein
MSREFPLFGNLSPIAGKCNTLSHLALRFILCGDGRNGSVKMMHGVASLHGDKGQSDVPIQTGPWIGVQFSQSSFPHCSDINVLRPTDTYRVHVDVFRQN